VVRLFPKNRLLGIVVSGCLGLVLPMCECGVVPVVRRLMRKGVPVSCGVTYLLASPIVNPLVILSTLVAFRGKNAWAVAGLRVGLGYLVAVLVGIAVWKLLGEKNVLLPKDQQAHENTNHEHEQAHQGSIIGDALSHAAADFVQIGAFLVIGAALAAVINSGFSRTSVESFAANPIAAVGAMAVLAIGLNLCSEADAFVAASFGAFPLAAKMAFLVLGPMVDLKLLAMYVTVFRPRAIVVISGLTTLLVIALGISGYYWMPMVVSLL
jgi:uncharacterized membrane protein YraQ (UPF0718 family)